MILTALTLCAGSLACQSWQAPEAAPPERARWIETGGVSEGLWLGWGETGPRRAEAPTRGAWLALEFDVPALDGPAAPWILELADGAVWMGQPGPAGAEVGLQFWALSGGGPLLPVDPLWLRRMGRGRLPGLVTGEEDHLWLRRAGGVLDLQRGFLLDWSARGLRFEGPAGERDHDWEGVDSFALLAEPMEEAADLVWLGLVDGSTLAARVVGQDPREGGGSWRIEMPWGAAATLPARAVSRIRRREGVEEWASLAWERRGVPAAQAVDWSPKVNRSVEGGLLRLGDRVYPQGIGVRAPEELARPVAGPGTMLATVGVDASVQAFRQPQPVRFRVLLDEEELAATRALTAADGPLPLLVSVPRAGTLRLLAEPVGPPPAHGTHANWCDLIYGVAHPAAVLRQ